MVVARHSYDFSFKNRAIVRYDEVRNISGVSREFGISRKTLREWLGRRNTIGVAAAHIKKRALCGHYMGRPVQNPTAEEILHGWFLGERAAGRSVSNLSLCSKMRQLTGGATRASCQWVKGNNLPA
jgi:ribosomal protein S14